MDIERIVYDSFAFLYDKGEEKRGGKAYVSLAALLDSTKEVEKQDVLQVVDKWIAVGFLTREEGLLGLTDDGKVFFKAKYRV